VSLLFLSIYEEERRYACFDVGVSLKVARIIQRNYQIHSTALHAGSAVNANDLSVHPVAIFGGKEADDARNVYWLTNTIVW
jgi:N-methylhydantoinase A/oxoprolinase/acetone carboxylase beta subunit